MKKVRINALSFAKLIAKLQKTPVGIRPAGWTYKELSDDIGLHYLSIREYVNAMHKEGVVRVAHWGPDGLGRICVRCFALSDGAPDAVKPPALTKSQRSARYRQRRQAEKAEPRPGVSDSRRDRALRKIGKVWHQGVAV